MHGLVLVAMVTTQHPQFFQLMKVIEQKQTKASPLKVNYQCAWVWGGKINGFLVTGGVVKSIKEEEEQKSMVMM